MFSRILIANRGEIALRIIKACKSLGIETVVVYSTADKNALYLKLADDAVCIGPPQSAKSYLHIPSIISAAEIYDVDAIHPGYGFLAENPHFANVCRSCRIEFIGPSEESLALMGNKNRARQLAREVGVPVVPGSEGLITDDAEAIKIAHEIGFPVIIKDSAGGGGRGMRVARNDVSLASSIMAARAEAGAAFGDSSIYIEKYIENPRHVEIQILADQHGNAIHLGERDCSVQRRHQKIIEESPSPAVDNKLRNELGNTALKLVRRSKYYNAGTVEFLVDANRRFYFIEMNARIQVEHPVTEMITRTDLVKEQIRIAAGEKLAYRQKDIRLKGWAIECRINAEDPAKNFAPCPGRINIFSPSTEGGVRVDTHVYSGYEVPPNYDSLLAKVIVSAKDRPAAIQKMLHALDDFLLEGVKTTVPFHKLIMEHEKFVSGDFDTGFIEKYF